MAFDRYSQFRNDGAIEVVPFAEIPISNSDFYETYRQGQTRLDLLSYDYYGSGDYAWLILQANPEYGSLEFRIPDGATLRIPYPLGVALSVYQESVETHKKLYGE